MLITMNVEIMHSYIPQISIIHNTDLQKFFTKIKEDNTNNMQD